MIKIFNDADTADVILNHVLERGIAGLTGDRATIRKRLAEIRGRADWQRHPDIAAVATVYHFWGELAFIYNGRLFGYFQARELVIDAYDEQLAAQGIFPDAYQRAQ